MLGTFYLEEETIARTPYIVKHDTLLWHEGDEDRHILVGTPAWHDWLMQATNFAFMHQSGTYTARKEHVQRGGWYWRAYLKRGGRLYRAYLGKSEELTLERLVLIAQSLTSSTLPAQTRAVEVKAQESTPSIPPGYPLLSTKLSLPPLRPHVIARSHLSARLQQAREYPLTLVSAPAGFGKTTLLSEWSSHSHHPIAWVSLDTNDNDPIRFWTYVFAAFDKMQEGIGTAVSSLLHSPQPLPIEAILTTLINALVALPHDILCVLDDYHLINTSPIHHAVQFLLEHLPTNVHLIIVSRVDPPFPLARLRGRKQLFELHMDDLRFTLDETTTFLQHKMALNLSSRDICALETRTEGWIAGLQLAALSLQGSTDRAGFVAAFSGSQRYIIDYLVEEVLHHQPEKVQRFLLQTCILERMDATLCDALTGETTGQQMLHLLDQTQLFIVPLDHVRQWYRYHALFAEALRTQLQQIHPQWLSELHVRASRWYESHELLTEAIDHALLATDFERAATLIEKAAQTSSTVWLRSGFSPLQRWLNILPPAFLRRQPQLRILYAWKLFSSLPLDPSIKLEAVETWVHDAERDLVHVDAAPQVQAMRGEIAAILAFTSLFRGNSIQSTHYGQQALLLLPQETITVRGFAAQTLINNHEFFGNTAATNCIFDELLHICQATHDPPARMNALCSIAQLHKLQGQLKQAAEVYRLAQEPSELLLKPTVSGTIALELGTLLLEWNEVDAAERALTAGIEQCKEGGDPGIMRNGYLGLARLRRIQGDIDGAFAALAEIERLLHKLHVLSHYTFGKLLLSDVAASRTQLYLLQNNRDAANRWAQTCKPMEDEDLTSLRLRELCTRARVYLANQQIEEGLQLFARLIHASEQRAPIVECITLLLVHAGALSARGDVESALHAVAKALTLAEPGGYIRIFVDEGPLMADLLEKLQKQKQLFSTVSLPYLCRLRAAFAPQASTSIAQIAPAPQANAFQLSKREMEVLRLLTAGLTDREIANHLVLAEGTVKTHAKRIYVKLGVQNRTQAALYAKELHLL